jgi:NADP-dependent 3-hydroxy acid dehydrogenase YdfG
MDFSAYRTVLVTGASSGIGAQIVRRLSAEGLEVHALARNEERLKALAVETGCRIHAISVDDGPALEKLAAELPVDILVNNAGQSRKGDILNTTAEDVDALLDINLKSVMHMVRLFVPGMVERDLGHVVNISSIAAHYAFAGGNTAYHASKAGVHSLCQQLRVHLYGKQVRVTEISPARCETEVFGRLLGDMVEAQRRFFDEYESLKPEDIAEAIAFCIGSPQRMNVSFMEVLPTKQVLGGLNFAKRA